jgi:UDP-N-acetylmuramoyl-tripeptide--D-alanyl-D-alanine ligase
VAFINSEDTILSNMAKRFDNPIFYPAAGDFLHLELTDSYPYLEFKSEDRSMISTSLIGKYNFYNAAAALCVGKFFKVPGKSAERAVAEYVPTNNRSQMISRGSNTIILDAYNANPSSMGAALDNLITMGSGHKTVILGDMMELGQESVKAHQEMVEKTLLGIDLVLLCGPLMSGASQANPKALHFDSKSSLIVYLKNNPLDQTTVLIKASRSMGLEEMVGYL